MTEEKNFLFGEHNEDEHNEGYADKLRYLYMLLSRLQSDCKYFLGFGNRQSKYLWAGSVEEQISEMKKRWKSFRKDEKPEWLSWEQIETYEKEMLDTK